MKNNIKLLSILISMVIFLQSAAKSVLSDPFVVLEYRNNNSKSFEVSNNPFINNENFYKKYKVKKNETLSDIILKNYGVKHFNKDVLSLSIVHFNKHAFVRKNPNFLFANKTLHLPSVLEIKNLIIKTKPNFREDLNEEKHIYFFGG
jgi:Tfp pilus assembly protein FimV